MVFSVLAYTMGHPGAAYARSHLATRVEESSTGILVFLHVCVDMYACCRFAPRNESGGVIYMYTPIIMCIYR